MAALADAPSDAASSKRTLAVRRGEPRARRTVLVVTGAAILATPLAVPRAPVVVWLAAMAIAGATLYRNAKLEGGADSIDHVRCERFTGGMLGTIAVVILTWSFALAVTHFAA